MHSVKSLMDKDQILENFISDIKCTFPEVAQRIDQQMEALEIEPEDRMYTQMFECFSQATTDAIKANDLQTASKYLKYMSRKLDAASGTEREYIDVYYTEPLMWDIKDRNLRSRGWQLFPQNLKKLYENFWGKQDW